MPMAGNGVPPVGLTPGAPLPAPKTLDVAGNASQGQDSRLFPQSAVPQMRT